MPTPKTNSSESVLHAIRSRDIVDFSAYAPKLAETPANPTVLAEMVSGLSAIADIMLTYLQSVGEEKTVTASNGVITIPDAIGGLPTALVIPYHGEIVGTPSMDSPAEVIFPTPIRFAVNGELYTFTPGGFAGVADVAKGTETVQKEAIVLTGAEEGWGVSGTGENRYLRNDTALQVYGTPVSASAASNYLPSYDGQITTGNSVFGVSNSSRSFRARNEQILGLTNSTAASFARELYESGTPLIVVVNISTTGAHVRNCQQINILLQPGQNVIEFEDTGIGAFCTYRGTPATAGLGSIQPGLDTSALTNKADTDVVEPVTDTIKEEE